MSIRSAGMGKPSTQRQALALGVAFALALNGLAASSRADKRVPEARSYVIVDGAIYRASELPARYRAYWSSATPEERIDVITLCSGGPNLIGDRSHEEYCRTSFLPRFPLRELRGAAARKLEAAISDRGGRIVDWASGQGGPVGLGVDDEGRFLLAELSKGGAAVTLAPLTPASTDYQELWADCEGVGCRAGAIRLLIPWRHGALVACTNPNGAVWAFFVFPLEDVHAWWRNSAWPLDQENATGHPLVNADWDGLWPLPGTNKVRIPAYDARDPNRVSMVLTLHLDTGEFFSPSGRLYPEVAPYPPKELGPCNLEGPATAENDDSGGDEE